MKWPVVKNNVLVPLLVAMIVSSVAITKLYLQIPMGGEWDTYSFSLNALHYAGMGTGYVEFSRGPFVPFLASLVFRLGYVNINVMMALDAALMALGAIFLYYLVNLKVNIYVAAASAILFATSHIILEWTAVGYTDIASVTLSIVALFCWVKGLDEDMRYIPFSWLFLALAFYTRTTAALIIVPMIFYYVTTQQRITHVPHHIAGIMCAILASIPVMQFYSSMLGTPFGYFNLVIWGLDSSVSSEGVRGEIYSYSKYYFLEHIENALFISEFHIIAIILVIISTVILPLLYLRNTKKRIMSFWLFLTYVVLFFISFTRFSFILTEGLLFIGSIAFYRYAGTRLSNNKAAFFLMMALWGLSYFVFHSSFYQKVPRYYITMMPSLSFLIASGTCTLGSILGTVSNRRLLGIVFAASLLSISIGYSSIAYLHHLEGHGQLPDITASEEISYWMLENQEDLDRALIYSDLWVMTGWYMRNPNLSMPFFSDKGYYEHELQKYGVDYYLTTNPTNFESYKKIHSDYGVHVLKRIQDVDKTRGLYIGRSWENYFEYLIDYTAYLMHGEEHIRQASTYVDDYDLATLQQYDFIALYNFKWNNYNEMNNVLMEYVSSGGTIIIDCSNNFDDPVFSLDKRQFLTMYVERIGLSGTETVVFSAPDMSYDFSPFYYNGKKWHGATYTKLGDTTTAITQYASVDGHPLAMKESVGDGSIVWLGCNLAFHAFEFENESEGEFIEYIVSEAIER